MSVLIIEGPSVLSGETTVHGAKNSALPIMAASVLLKGETVLKSCPKLSDVESTARILRHLGFKCARQDYHGEKNVVLISGYPKRCEIPHYMMRKMRSSVVFLGALLGRIGEARLSFPGGCDIGARPIDLHLSSLRRLGVEINEKHGCIICTAPKGIIGDYVTLSFPSVGATENIMLASVISKGTTVIENAAREPEIIDLANFLNACGARISGQGESTLIIEGVSSLYGCEYKIMPDRIVAATYIACCGAAGGEIVLKNSPNQYILPMLSVFEDAGCVLSIYKNSIYVKAPKKLLSPQMIRTMPYPGFPTDAQAQVMAMSTVAEGTTVFVENIFENRFQHIPELVRLGAKIKAEGKVAVVEGVKNLSGAFVKAPDLRAGAALVTAGLAAGGITTVGGIEYIDRGYESIERDISQLGGKIKRV